MSFKKKLIPFNDFTREPKELILAEVRGFTNVISSGNWILGDNVTSFEKLWSEECCTEEAIGVGNGCDAIEIGLRALDIGIGDEVITTPLTAFATTLAIARTGATPVFADIEPATCCIDPNSVRRCLSNKTKAIVVVHLYGQAADIDSLLTLSNQHRIHLIEDCAQAHLASFNNKPVGSYGIFGAWSFYPTKNLGAIGDAGAITTNDTKLAEKARQLRNYGQMDRYKHVVSGLNSRLDELQASILIERFQYLKSWTNRRKEIALRYWNEISNSFIELLHQPNNSNAHVNHLFVIRANSKTRDYLQNYFESKGIQTLIHYPILCNEQIALECYRNDPKGLLSAIDHSNRCISLPINPFLEESEVNYIIDACNNLK